MGSSRDHQGVAEDLPGGRRERPEARLDAVRHVDAAEPLAHLLAREVEVGAVVEGEGHVRESEDRHRTHAREAGQAVQLLLDRQRDLPLDLLGGVAGEERDHVDLRVGELGEGLDRQVPEGEHPRHREGGRECDHRERLAERHREQAAHGRRARHGAAGEGVIVAEGQSSWSAMPNGATKHRKRR